jgi:hypothetical protein
VDNVKGFINAPFTLNHYGYCWGNPVGLADNDGNWPSWSDIKQGASDIWNNYIFGTSETNSYTVEGEYDGAVGISNETSYTDVVKDDGNRLFKLETTHNINRFRYS